MLKNIFFALVLISTTLTSQLADTKKDGLSIAAFINF